MAFLQIYISMVTGFYGGASDPFSMSEGFVLNQNAFVAMKTQVYCILILVHLQLSLLKFFLYHVETHTLCTMFYERKKIFINSENWNGSPERKNAWWVVLKEERQAQNEYILTNPNENFDATEHLNKNGGGNNFRVKALSNEPCKYKLKITFARYQHSAVGDSCF